MSVSCIRYSAWIITALIVGAGSAAGVAAADMASAVGEQLRVVAAQPLPEPITAQVKALPSVLMPAGMSRAQAETRPDTPPPYSKSYRQIITVRPGHLLDHLITNEVLVGTDESAKQFMTWHVEFNQDLQSVEIVEAATLKADGRRLNVGAEGIVTRVKPVEVREANSFDLDERVTTITFPDLAAGDRIRVTTKYTGKRAGYPGGIFIRSSIGPESRFTDYSLILDAPADLRLRTEEKGFVLEKTERGGRIVYEWKLTDLAHRPAETLSISSADHGPYVKISSFADWKAVGDTYCERAKPMMAVTPEIAQFAEEITRGRIGVRSQTQAIFDWVRSNIRYVSIVLGSGGIVPRPAASVIANRYGDCKDHATLMRALLAAKGIGSESVLVNTQPEYQFSPIPQPNFDHVVVHIPELNLYADPTNKNSTFGTLGDGLYDKPVLHCGLDRTTTARIPALTSDTNTATIRTDLTITADGAASGSTKVEANGEQVQALTALLNAADTRGESVVMTERLSSEDLRGAAQLDAKVLGDDGISGSIAVRFSIDNDLLGEDNGRAAITGPYIIARPFLYYGSVFQAERERDFICIPQTYREIVSYRVPDGWQPDRLPRNVSRKGGPAEFTARYVWDSPALTVDRTFSVRNDGNVCRAAQAGKMAPVYNAAIRDAAVRLTFVPTDAAAGVDAQHGAAKPKVHKDAAPLTPDMTQTVSVVTTLGPDNILEAVSTRELLIRTHRGAEVGAQMSVTTREDDEVEILEAATLKADGRRLEVPADKIMTRGAFSGNGKLLMRTIVFPDVAVGDRIRYVVRGRKARPDILGGFTFGVDRDASVDADAMSYSLDVPADMNLRIATEGFKQTVSTSNGRTRYRWVPEPGPYKPFDFDQLLVFLHPQQYVQVSSFSDWASAANVFCRPANAASISSPEVAKLAGEITGGHTSRPEQARALFDWLAANIADTEESPSQSGWSVKAPTNVLHDRRGSSADRASLLRAMLAARGIDAHYTLINFPKNFTVKRVPSPEFSEVILYLPEFDLYAETAHADAVFGTLVEGHFGVQFLRCGPGEPAVGQMPQSSAGANSADVVAELTVGEDGKAKGVTTITATGTSAAELNAFRKDIARDGFAPVMRGKLTDLDLRGTAQLEGGQNTVGAVTLSFELDDNLLGEDNAKRVIVGPRVAGRPFRIFGERVKQEKTSPFFCFPKSYRETVTYRLPKGWVVQDLPRNVVRRSGPAEFNATYQANEGSMKVERSFVLSTGNSVCAPEVAADIAPAIKAAERDAEELLTFVRADAQILR